MRFGILGPLVVIDDQGRELDVGGSKQRSVLAILLLHAGEVVLSERLIDELWGERRRRARRRRCRCMSRTCARRSAMGWLVTRGGGYLLQCERGEVDRDRFQRC